MQVRLYDGIKVKQFNSKNAVRSIKYAKDSNEANELLWLKMRFPSCVHL